MNQLEREIVGMIPAAGDSKAKALEALGMVKESRYSRTHELLAQARKIGLGAYKIQTKLITAETNDNDKKLEIGLSMVYVQDHYMTFQLARDLIEEMMSVSKVKEGKQHENRIMLYRRLLHNHASGQHKENCEGRCQAEY